MSWLQWVSVFFHFETPSTGLSAALRVEKWRACVINFILSILFPTHQSSACRRPTRAGLRTLASNLGAMDRVTSCQWRRAAVPTWQGYRPGTRSWKSRVTTCQLWVPKPSSPSPRLRRIFRPASEWCPAYSRSSSFLIRCMLCAMCWQMSVQSFRFLLTLHEITKNVHALNFPVPWRLILG